MTQETNPATTASAPATVPAGPPGPSANVPVEPVRPLALAEVALNAAGVMWIEAPGDHARPCWYAWVAGGDDRPAVAYVVNGPGEQDLPYLPAQVTLHLKSKDTGARITKVTATAEVLTAADPRWQAAADTLAAGRLNSTDDVHARWRDQCTITALTPVGTLLELPTDPDTHSGTAQITPAPGTTGMNHPWHLNGRAKTMRARRQLRQRAEQAEG